MDFARSIDLYCERTDASFWSEPLNATSNLAFIAAAILLARSIGRLRETGAGARLHLRLLALLVFCVGIGSVLFHTTARVWSSYADILFIALFTYTYYAFFLRRVIGLGWGTTVTGIAVWELFAGVSRRAVTEAAGADALNGSEAYLGPLLALALMAVFAQVRRLPGRAQMSGTLAVFAASLLLRTIDQKVCTAFPLGTHFLWHLLNGLALYLAVEAAARMARNRGQGDATPHGGVG